MKFIALGATDTVGASCYFLQVDGLNFLLDCGKGLIDDRGRTFGPDFTTIIPSMLTSLSQLDAIFISHGHYDHIGYLPEIIKQCPNTPIYATHLTQKLGWYLMLDRYYGLNESSHEKRIGAETNIRQVLERIQPMDYMQPIWVGTVQVTFHEAGHVPGAAMIMIESQREGRLLYTGDFCKASSSLTPGYCLPSNHCPDFLLMCGLHAKHPQYVSPNNLNSIFSEIRCAINENKPCLIPARELTKGMEIVSFLVDKMQTGDLPPSPLFMDDYIWTLSERLQENGFFVFNEHCRRFPRYPFMDKPGIYVGGNGYRRCFDTVYNPNFSLHGDFADCSNLISTLQPKKVILVHSPTDSSLGHHGNTALESKHHDTTFIYPIVGHQYNLI